jgi:NADPH:quinone reductase-like Zn-dependent oxidoreductase
VKAAVRDRYGPPEVVAIRDIEPPVPKDGEVLVRVCAASVNRADLDALYARWAFLRLFLGIRAPRNRRLGLDAAGTVEAVGAGVTRFQPGDQVFGDLSPFGQDAFSELVCAPDKAWATVPEGLSFEQAATLPHSAILALQGLRLRDGRTIKAGDAVMVVGASGNVGPFAIQIAKHRGAHVIGVASGSKLELVRSLGADEVIDYETVDYTRLGRPLDWIVDVNAHHSVLRWRDAVRRPGGVYVAMGAESAAWFAKTLLQGPALSAAIHGHMGLMLWWKPFDPSDVETIKELLVVGAVRPVIDRTYPLSGIVEALRYFDEGHARGKVIVVPD